MDSWPDPLGKTTEPQVSRNSDPQERVEGPVQLTIMAWNSDSISDSDTTQLFVLHVLTLSQLPKKKPPQSTYEIIQKVIRRRNTKASWATQSIITIALNCLLQKTIENYNSVKPIF